MIIRAFTKTYGDFKLSVPELEFKPGSITALVGANGCGKSTYAKTAAGIISDDRGSRVCESNSVGYMSQSSFAFRMSVKKNVMINTDDEAKADSLIASLGISDIADKNAKKLSGGQTARMALARILVKEYELLILDEPTASMDMESSLLAESEIMKYKEQGPAVLLITHSLQQARRIADEIIYFDNGVLVEQGSSEELLSSPKDERTAKFIEFYGI